MIEAETKAFTKTLLTICISLILVSIVGRGILQSYVDKSQAIFLQFAIIASLSMCVFCLIRVRDLCKGFLFISIHLVTLLSIVFTVWQYGYFGWRWLGIYFLALVWVLAVPVIKRKNLVNYAALQDVFAVVFAFVIICGFFQQIGLFQELPGLNVSDVVRPHSTLGTYLHYPIFVSMGSLIFLSLYSRTRETKFLLFFIIGSIATFLANSRYGVLEIVVGTALLGGFLLKNKTTVFIICALLVVVVSQNTELLLRLANDFTFDGIGNKDRISSWDKAISIISPYDILFGKHFGIFSNSNFDNATPFRVPESSLLLLLLNFGFIGTIIFIYILFSIYYFSKLMTLGLAFLAPSLFVQSVEMIPFIMLFCLAPLLHADEGPNTIRNEA